MPDELTTRLVARTKALGLVAATAMVTTALAGGGVVAVTVVGNEKPVGQQQAGVPGEQRSDTATATIGGKPTKSPKPGKPVVDAPTCTDAKNHGAFVSGVARSASPGPSHGPLVAAAATSDCGKTAKPTRTAKPKPTKTGRPDSPGKSAGKGKSDSAGRD